MKKKEIIYYFILLAFFLFFILSSDNLPITIIGVLAFIVLLWACSKQEKRLRNTIADEVKKNLDEQAIEKNIRESEEKDIPK